MKDGRPAARSFRDLLVWQKAHSWMLELYALDYSFSPTRNLWIGITDAERCDFGPR